MPLETPVTAPPTQTATPPAPTPPSPVSAPPAPIPAPSGGTDDNPFSEVWAKADAHIKEIDKDLSKPGGEPAKPAPPKPEVKPEPGKPEPTKPDPKAAKPSDKPKSEPHKLRDELDARTAELATFKENHAKLEAKLKELETKGQDTEKVLARIGQLEKERDDIVKERESLAAKLKVIRLEQDPEFQKEHDQKFNRAADLAKDFFEKIDVLGVTGNDAEGNPVMGPVRKASWQRDFVKIWHQYKDSPIAAFAEMKRLLGDDAARLVLPKIEGLVDLERARNEKLEESRAKAKEMQAQEESQAATRKQQLDALWVKANQEVSERNPDFKLDPTDKELAQVREESLRIFDGRPANDEQRLIKNVHIRQMVGSFAVQKMIIARLNKQLADTKAELETFKNPTPPPSKRATGGSPAAEPDEDWATRAKKDLANI